MATIEAGVARDLAAPLPPPGPLVATLTGKSRFREVFRPHYGKRTLLLSIFNLVQTIGFYGFGALVPTLLIAKGIHITTRLEYAFIIAIANPVGPLLGMLVADRMERKWQIVCAGIGIGVFMLLFALQANPALIVLFGVLVTLSNNWM